MSTWLPRLERRTGPRYQRIAAALRDDIAAGKLAPGTRLPTHRELADALGVTVGTITRAYAEAARQNLVTGEIGRGTYVRGESRREEAFPEAGEPTDDTLDLALSRPVVNPELLDLHAAVTALSNNGALARWLDYQPNVGLHEHRRIAARWMARRGLDATAERMVITAGGQNGIAVVLAALTQPGDTLLTERLTFPGLKGIAKVLRLQLVPVEMDEDGLVPDALEAAAVSRSARVLYTVPTLHNPTTVTMSAARRSDVAELARRLNLTVVEDDVHGQLAPDAPPPLTQFAPERCYCVESTSKYLAPGLRLGFVLAPEGRTSRVTAGVRAFTIMASPLLAELTCRWLADGTAERVVAWQRDEARARQRLAAKLLGDHVLHAQPRGFHLWLLLPEPWQTEDFVTQAREQGVLVSPASAFAVGRAPAPHAVRVGLGGVRERERLEQGLRVLAEILHRAPAPVFAIV